MLGAKDLFVNLQRPLVERFRRCIVRLRIVQPRKIVEATCSVRMLRAEDLFVNLQRPLVEWYRCWVIRLRIVQQRQIVEA